MTNEQIRLVKKSWRSLQGIKPETIAQLFYARLFTDRPALRRLFPANMQEQYRKLMDMLDAIVMRLDRLDELSEEITKMAQRHDGYGVKPAHYEYVGKALLWTLEKAFGPEWTPDVAQAWLISYQSLAKLMITAAGSKDQA
jgi:hemoglobin-like flavoprotein